MSTGYLIIHEFSERTYIDAKSALKTLRAEANNARKSSGDSTRPSGMKGLILDLRGNLGGTLPSALDVAALFLKRGTVLLRVKLFCL